MIPFTCENAKYKTNINLGFPHLSKEGYGGSNILGSVLQEPLFEDSESSLWLEHVYEHNKPNNKIFWLMWYDKKGRPTINQSAVFNEADLLKILKGIVSIKLTI